MQAQRVHAWGKPPRLDDVPEPVARDGHTRVRMHAATVGHIDLTIWHGGFGVHPPLPYVPGVEAAGTVVDGARFAPGTRVWLRGAGLGTRRDGTWRERIDAPDHALGELPDGIGMALGSAFFSPCTAAWVALHDVARLQPGERVLVTGATGAAGSVAAQLAHELGAEVRALVTDDSQPAALPACARPVRASELAQDGSLLVDTVGGDVLPVALRGIAPGGRAVLVGYTAGSRVALDLPSLMLADVSLLPLNMMRREAAARQAAPGLLRRLADGRLVLPVQEFAFADAARAMTWIADRGSRRARGRAVLAMP